MSNNELKDDYDNEIVTMALCQFEYLNDRSDIKDGVTNNLEPQLVKRFHDVDVSDNLAFYSMKGPRKEVIKHLKEVALKKAKNNFIQSVNVKPEGFPFFYASVSIVELKVVHETTFKLGIEAKEVVDQ